MIDCKKLDALMLDLGFDDFVRGTQYIRQAVQIWDVLPHCSMTKKVYPEIAAVSDTTASRVERAMRHAIEKASLRGSARVWADAFGCSISVDSGKPTNGQFVARLAMLCRATRGSVLQA